jgi:hypothetical protein
VLQGGYLSWHHPPSDHWWQVVWFGEKQEFRDLGVLARSTESLRAQIDRLTSKEAIRAERGTRERSLLAGMATESNADKATASKAAAWRAQIQALLR